MNFLSNTLYKKTLDGQVTMNNPTRQLLDYLSIGNVYLPEDTFNLNGENPEADQHTDLTKTNEVNNMLNGEDSQVNIEVAPQIVVENHEPTGSAGEVNPNVTPPNPAPPVGATPEVL